jgi:hypothetical protein
MNRFIVTSALAAVTGSGAFLAAQLPATPSRGQNPPAAPAAPVTAEKTPSTTLIGCVYREKDVPGRAPNVAERAGLLEDYIFAEVPSSPIATLRTPAPPDVPDRVPVPVGTSGSSGAMYKLAFVDADRLKQLVGKRVEIMGRIDAEAGDQRAPAAGQRSTTPDKSVGHDRVNLSEFEVSSIKEVAGTCPATPDPRP